MTQMSTATIEKPQQAQDEGVIFDRGWQVVLFNDDVNAFHNVVNWLMQIFGHTVELATKIALEAHKNGKTVAEVEGHDSALLHKQQLQSFGLCAEVEQI